MIEAVISLSRHLAHATTSKACAGVLPALAAAMAIFIASPVAAQTIIDEWGTVKAPPAPELKPATADNKTALLLLDFGKQNCGARPRCLTSVPKVQ